MADNIAYSRCIACADEWMIDGGFDRNTNVSNGPCSCGLLGMDALVVSMSLSVLFILQNSLFLVVVSLQVKAIR
jgi:hypothetical protein